MIKEKEKNAADTDLKCLSKESVYDIHLSNMVCHFCLSLKLIHDLSIDFEHQTSYVEHHPLAWYLITKEKKQNSLKSNINRLQMFRSLLKCQPHAHSF